MTGDAMSQMLVDLHKMSHGAYEDSKCTSFIVQQGRYIGKNSKVWMLRLPTVAQSYFRHIRLKL